ncbi:MAG: hypothetical protein ACW99G_21625 [Candidatus Thorarchaeota archaeon]|jgi:hypothetical protein
MQESAEKMMAIGFSQIRDGLTQIESVSKLMGMIEMIVSVSDDDTDFEAPLKHVLESIRISLDFEQRRRLPDIP